MNIVKSIFFVFVSICIFSSCSVKYLAEPILLEKDSIDEICIIENPKVNKTFLPALKIALEKRGFNVRIITSEPDDYPCEISSTYVGKWSRGIAKYMAYADITIYQNGEKIGNIRYEAPRGGWSLTRKIHEKTAIIIDNMVAKLFQ